MALWVRGRVEWHYGCMVGWNGVVGAWWGSFFCMLPIVLAEFVYEELHFGPVYRFANLKTSLET